MSPDGDPGLEWQELEPGRLWLAEHDLRAAGMELGRRMTVVRLAGGDLWLHSVARPDPELRRRVEALGPLRFLVAPNLFHTRWLEDWTAAYPGAELHGAPGLPPKMPGLEFDAVLGDAPDPRWADDLDQTVFVGGPRFHEVVFLDRVSRTLILTDLCFDIPPGRGIWTSLAARSLGTYRRFGTSRLLKRLVTEPARARDAVDRIMEWDFDRVVIGHGTVVESGGKDAFARAFAWLRARPAWRYRSKRGCRGRALPGSAASRG